MSPEIETPQDWYFTFGADHTHPDTGQRLGRSYVVIHGTCDSTRDAMFEAFGNRWSHQYIDADRAGVAEYNLSEVPMPGGQSFDEQVQNHLQRLDAERSKVVEERTEEQPQQCPNCAPGYDCERGIYTPSEEQSGGAAALRTDVVTSVVEEVAALRRNMARYAHAKEHEEPHAAAASYIAMKLGLDRVEQLVSGEQQ